MNCFLSSDIIMYSQWHTACFQMPGMHWVVSPINILSKIMIYNLAMSIIIHSKDCVRASPNICRKNHGHHPLHNPKIDRIRTSPKIRTKKDRVCAHPPKRNTTADQTAIFYRINLCPYTKRKKVANHVTAKNPC